MRPTAPISTARPVSPTSSARSISFTVISAASRPASGVEDAVLGEFPAPLDLLDLSSGRLGPGIWPDELGINSRDPLDAQTMMPAVAWH